MHIYHPLHIQGRFFNQTKGTVPLPTNMAPQDSTLHRISPVAQGWPLEDLTAGSPTAITHLIGRKMIFLNQTLQGIYVPNAVNLQTLQGSLTFWEFQNAQNALPTWHLAPAMAYREMRKTWVKSTVSGAWLLRGSTRGIKRCYPRENQFFSMGNYIFKWWMFECHVSFFGGHVYMLCGDLNWMWCKGNLTTCCDVPHLVYTGMCLILPSSFWSQLTSNHTTIMLPYSWTAVTCNKFNTLAYNQTP